MLVHCVGPDNATQPLIYLLVQIKKYSGKSFVNLFIFKDFWQSF